MSETGAPINTVTTTYQGLNDWFKHVFEHYGWMILAAHDGKTQKVDVYLASLRELEKQIEARITAEGNENKLKKQDLEVLLKKLRVLKTEAEECLKTGPKEAQSGGAHKKKSKTKKSKSKSKTKTKTKSKTDKSKKSKKSKTKSKSKSKKIKKTRM